MSNMTDENGMDKNIIMVLNVKIISPNIIV